MKKSEAISELEIVIIKEMVKEVNSMLGTNPTAFLSTSLLLKLQPQFVVTESPYAKLPKASSMEDLDSIFRSFVPFDNPSAVIFELFYDSKKTLKRALTLAAKHSSYFSFHYIKHLHGTLAKSTTTAYIQAIMKQVADKASPFTIAGIAVDRQLNTLALKTLAAAEVDTRAFSQLIDTMKTTDLNEELAAISIDFDNLTVTKIPKYIKKLRLVPIEHIAEALEIVSVNEQGMGDYGYSKGATKAHVVVDLATSLAQTISSSCKGTDVGNLMATSFESSHIDALWFDNLNRSLVSQLLAKANEGYSTWANISKTKRHMYHSPIRVSSEHKLQLYVTIDHSGSVSTGDLQKVLSVFEQYSHLISSAVVMHHTTNILQQYTLTDAYGDIAEHPEFAAAFACRHGDGGTSHLDCVNAIAKHITKHDIDPTKALWLSFSDGYSDLEDVCMSQSAVLSKLDTYFIRDSHGRDINLRLIPGISHNVVTP